MSVLETTPIGTQAGIVDRVLHEAHPRTALPTIASNFGLTIVDLQAILHRHGYPDVDRMRRAVEDLRLKAAAAIDPRPMEEEPEHGVLSRVPITKLHVDPDNVRGELRDIEDLADSMKEAGLIQPIVARRHQGRLIVVAGHRRLAAARLLHWTEIPCIVRAEMRPDDVLAAMLIENGQRSDLDPIDEARGLHRLKIQLNLSDLDLARKVGRSQPFVSTRLSLISLSAEDQEQEQVRNGTMKLAEASHRGRMNSGKVKAPGQDKGWHLGPRHDLANLAKARCIRLEHPRGRTVGGMACGECWESVIRADERTDAQTRSVELGYCATCGTEPQVTP